MGAEIPRRGSNGASFTQEMTVHLAICFAGVIHAVDHASVIWFVGTQNAGLQGVVMLLRSESDTELDGHP